jgi:hypothetical protein
MFDLQLPLFPFDSSSITVTTTVWIGVVITVFFNLRLGWTLSALVIPGYVVPLMIARPSTAVIILIESMITYWFATWVSESNRMHPYWSSVFGRDRFFLIIVLSVLVRSLCDGWLLPAGGRWLVENMNFDIDYRNDLSSYGLIAVALIANYFWKPGVMRGLPCLLTTVGLTWVVVALFLVPFTNFNIGSFHLLYEDISTSMLSSPKAYIVILVTGWLASWVNLRYAWDFNGILIPALFAMLWAEPHRILFSMVEICLVLGIGKLLVSSKPFRNVAIQGGRKLVFFFTVCFLIRFVLSHTLSNFAPDLKVTDFFGLGYLLSTLVAIKISDKKASIRMSKGVLQISAVGAVLACFIGFTLDRLDFSGLRIEQIAQKSVASTVLIESDRKLFDLFKDEKVRLYRDRSDVANLRPTKQQLNTFRAGLEKLKDISEDLASESNKEALDEIARELASVNYELLLVGGKHILLRESEPFLARGWIVVTPENKTGISIVAPNAIKEKWCAESAMSLHQALDAGAVAVFGTAPHPSKSNSRTNDDAAGFEASFNEVFAARDGLYVRAEPESRNIDSDRDTQNVLEVQRCLPNSLNLRELRRVVGDFQFRWIAQPERKTPFRQTSFNLLGDQTGPVRDRGSSAATIILTNESRRLMVARASFENGSHRPVGDRGNMIVKGSLSQWLLSVKEEICSQGSDQYRAPKEEELLFIDEAILNPLFKLANEDSLSSVMLQNLKAIDSEAKSTGYRIQIIEDENTGDVFIALREQVDPANRLGWGTAVFRLGLKEPCGVEVSRPLYERRSFEFGSSVFQRHNASALFIAGAHPHSNLDRSSDLTKSSNRANLLGLTRHVLFRELRDRPWLIVQARSSQSPIISDIVIATDAGATNFSTLSPMQKRLSDSFVADGLTIDFVDGRADVAGYELGMMLRAASVQVADNKEIMSLWVSPGLRSKFRPQDPSDSLNSQLRACGMKSSFESREEIITSAQGRDGASSIPESLRNQLLEFSKVHDVVKLYSLVSEFDGLGFDRFFDDQTNSTLIVVTDDQGRAVALFNPRGLNDRIFRVEKFDSRNVQDFILSRSFFMEVQ